MIPYQTHYFALVKNKNDSVVKTNILKYWFLNSCSCPSLENFYQKHFPIQDIETAVSYDIKKFISYPFTRYWQYYMLYNLSVLDKNIDPENFPQILEMVHSYI
jgi:hypothetical protein